jgi:hypothetical protein
MQQIIFHILFWFAQHGVLDMQRSNETMWINFFVHITAVWERPMIYFVHGACHIGSIIIFHRALEFLALLTTTPSVCQIFTSQQNLNRAETLDETRYCTRLDFTIRWKQRNNQKVKERSAIAF